MLQLLCADWIVRFFLLYLLLVGGLTLIRRQRPELSSPLHFLVLAGFSDRWTGRQPWGAGPRGKWLSNYRNQEGYRERSHGTINI